VRRRHLLKKIGDTAAVQGKELVFVRDRGGHTVFSVAEVRFTVPRHVEIGEGLVEAIFHQLQPALGAGWWR